MLQKFRALRHQGNAFHLAVGVIIGAASGVIPQKHADKRQFAPSRRTCCWRR